MKRLFKFKTTLVTSFGVVTSLGVMLSVIFVILIVIAVVLGLIPVYLQSSQQAVPATQSNLKISKTVELKDLITQEATARSAIINGNDFTELTNFIIDILSSATSTSNITYKWYIPSVKKYNLNVNLTWILFTSDPNAQIPNSSPAFIFDLIESKIDSISSKSPPGFRTIFNASAITFTDTTQVQDTLNPVNTNYPIKCKYVNSTYQICEQMTTTQSTIKSTTQPPKVIGLTSLKTTTRRTTTRRTTTTKLTTTKLKTTSTTASSTSSIMLTTTLTSLTTKIASTTSRFMTTSAILTTTSVTTTTSKTTPTTKFTSTILTSLTSSTTSISTNSSTLASTTISTTNYLTTSTSLAITTNKLTTTSTLTSTTSVRSSTTNITLPKSTTTTLSTTSKNSTTTPLTTRTNMTSIFSTSSSTLMLNRSSTFLTSLVSTSISSTTLATTTTTTTTTITAATTTETTTTITTTTTATTTAATTTNTITSIILSSIFYSSDKALTSYVPSPPPSSSNSSSSYSITTQLISTYYTILTTHSSEPMISSLPYPSTTPYYLSISFLSTYSMTTQLALGSTLIPSTIDDVVPPLDQLTTTHVITLPATSQIQSTSTYSFIEMMITSTRSFDSNNYEKDSIETTTILSSTNIIETTSALSSTNIIETSTAIIDCFTNEDENLTDSFYDYYDDEIETDESPVEEKDKASIFNDLNGDFSS